MKDERRRRWLMELELAERRFEIIERRWRAVGIYRGQTLGKSPPFRDRGMLTAPLLPLNVDVMDAQTCSEKKTDSKEKEKSLLNLILIFSFPSPLGRVYIGQLPLMLDECGGLISGALLLFSIFRCHNPIILSKDGHRGHRGLRIAAPTYYS